MWLLMNKHKLKQMLKYLFSKRNKWCNYLAKIYYNIEPDVCNKQLTQHNLLYTT